MIHESIRAEDHLPWVKKLALPLAKRMRQDLLDSDSFSDGCEGLVNAMAHYDPGLGFTFLTYANPIIRRHIKEGWLRRMGIGRRKEDRCKVRNIGNHVLSVASTERSDRDHEIAEETDRMIGLLKESVASLPQAHREVVEMRMSGMKLDEIAAHKGVKKQAVCQLLSRVGKKLKEEIVSRGGYDD